MWNVSIPCRTWADLVLFKCGSGNQTAILQVLYTGLQEPVKSEIYKMDFVFGPCSI
jgi:hypothetical protein